MSCCMPESKRCLCYEKIGESVKTRKVEIESWIDYEDEFQWAVYRQSSQRGLKPTTNSIPCKITFEIPVPERKVEITESELEKEYETFLNHADRFAKKMVFKDYLKQKLFPSGDS